MLANLLPQLADAVAQAADFLRIQLHVPELTQQAEEKGMKFDEMISSPFLRAHAEFYTEFLQAVYLFQDGRDVAVSYYFHNRKFAGYSGTLLDFLQADLWPCPWDRHVSSWIFENPRPEKVLVLRYEDLLVDTLGQLKQVLAFARLDLSEDRVILATEAASFERMQQIEKCKGLGYASTGDPRILFMRKGGQGNWRDHFGPHEKATFKQRYGAMLIRLGYEANADW